MSALPPQNLRAHIPELTLEICWSETDVARLPFRQLRGLCPCANCVNELSGERTFFPEDADPQVQPQRMELVGNYALRFHWSDGHHTGIYTWDYLRRICANQRQDGTVQHTHYT